MIYGWIFGNCDVPWQDNSQRILTCTQHHSKQRDNEGAFAPQYEKGLITVGQELLKAFALPFRATVCDHVGEIVGEHKWTAFSSNFPFQLEIAQYMPEVWSERWWMRKISDIDSVITFLPDKKFRMRVQLVPANQNLVTRSTTGYHH